METGMSKTIEEQISAFSDGELPDEELELLLHRLERVKAHRSTLATYIKKNRIDSSDRAYLDPPLAYTRSPGLWIHPLGPGGKHRVYNRLLRPDYWSRLATASLPASDQ